MTQIPYFTPSIPQGFPNRKGMLVTIGIVMILIGSISGCMAAVAPIGLVIQRTSGIAGAGRMTTISMIFGIALYAGVATGAIWTGIGSIIAKRWVRPIVLIVSTIWLGIGALSFIGVLIAMTNLPALIAASTTMPTTTTTTTTAGGTVAVSSTVVVVGGSIAVAFSFLFYIVLPGALIFFYRPMSVRQTLEFYDPQPRWTDYCPMPVLGMSIACMLLAAAVLVAMAYGVLSLFGVLITGPAAMIVLLVFAVIFAWSSVLIYRMQILGWNIAVIMGLLAQSSMIVSSLMLDIGKVAAAMGATTQEMEMMRENPLTHPIVGAIGGAILTIAGLIYAIRIRHYFRAPANGAAGV